MKLDKSRDETHSQFPHTIPWGTLSQAVKEGTSPKKPGWKRKLLAKKPLTLDLFWQLSSELHNLKNSHKNGSNPLSDQKFTFLFHFDNTNSSKAPISGISKKKMHII